MSPSHVLQRKFRKIYKFKIRCSRNDKRVSIALRLLPQKRRETCHRTEASPRSRHRRSLRTANRLCVHACGSRTEDRQRCQRNKERTVQAFWPFNTLVSGTEERILNDEKTILNETNQNHATSHKSY